MTKPKPKSHFRYEDKIPTLCGTHYYTEFYSATTVMEDVTCGNCLKLINVYRKQPSLPVRRPKLRKKVVVYSDY